MRLDFLRDFYSKNIKIMYIAFGKKSLGKSDEEIDWVNAGPHRFLLAEHKNLIIASLEIFGEIL